MTSPSATGVKMDFMSPVTLETFLIWCVAKISANKLPMEKYVTTFGRQSEELKTRNDALCLCFKNIHSLATLLDIAC